MPNGRVLTTHVGSLIRPPALVAHLKPMLKGEPYDEAGYEAALKDAVADIVARQAAIGLDIINDGEFGKTHWFRYVVDRFSGIESRPVDAGQTRFVGQDRERFSEFYAEYDRELPRTALQWAVTGPLAYRGGAQLKRDIDNLKDALARVDCAGGFLPVVAPASLLPELKNEFYANDQDYVLALAEALREEYKAITGAGLIVQIDDAWLPAMYERIVPPGSMDDYRRWARMCIEALNHVLRGIPQHLTRYHICWGSWNGPHTADLPLSDIIDLLLSIDVGAYSIEGANPRHAHEWRVWEHVRLPDERKLIPGVISHATNIIEHPELVAERIVRLARLVGADRVIAGTDCGFAQGALYRRVHPSIMWAKLEALVQGAELASRELFGRRAA